MENVKDLIARADALGNDDAPPKGAAPPDGTPPDGAQEPDGAAELVPLEGRICMQAATFAALVGKVFPSVRKVLTDEACEEIGTELAPLARKWKWDGPLQAFKYDAEVRALMTVAPLGFAIYQAIKEDLAVMNAEPVSGDDTRTASDAPPRPTTKPSGMIQPE